MMKLLAVFVTAFIVPNHIFASTIQKRPPHNMNDISSGIKGNDFQKENGRAKIIHKYDDFAGDVIGKEQYAEKKVQQFINTNANTIRNYNKELNQKLRKLKQDAAQNHNKNMTFCVDKAEDELLLLATSTTVKVINCGNGTLNMISAGINQMTSELLENMKDDADDIIEGSNACNEFSLKCIWSWTYLTMRGFAYANDLVTGSNLDLLLYGIGLEASIQLCLKNKIRDLKKRGKNKLKELKKCAEKAVYE